MDYQEGLALEGASRLGTVTRLCIGDDLRVCLLWAADWSEPHRVSRRLRCTPCFARCRKPQSVTLSGGDEDEIAGYRKLLHTEPHAGGVRALPRLTSTADAWAPSQRGTESPTPRPSHPGVAKIMQS